MPVFATILFLTNWSVCQEVLGFDINTQRMRMELPERKREEILQLLLKWSSTRKTATENGDVGVDREIASCA